MAGAWQVWAHPRSRSLRTGGAPSIEEPLIRTKLLSRSWTVSFFKKACFKYGCTSRRATLLPLPRGSMRGSMRASRRLEATPYLKQAERWKSCSLWAESLFEKIRL
jgi:hypothetical protein